MTKQKPHIYCVGYRNSSHHNSRRKRPICHGWDQTQRHMSHAQSGTNRLFRAPRAENATDLSPNAHTGAESGRRVPAYGRARHARCTIFTDRGVHIPTCNACRAERCRLLHDETNGLFVDNCVAFFPIVSLIVSRTGVYCPRTIQVVWCRQWLAALGAFDDLSSFRGRFSAEALSRYGCCRWPE